jgi:LysM repeat protein
VKIYFVKQGDTLSEIGKRFDVTVEELMKANPIISNPDDLKIGMKLIIPVKKEAKAEVNLNKDKDMDMGKKIPEPCVDVIPSIAQNLNPLQDAHQNPQQYPQQYPQQSLPSYPPQQYPQQSLPPYPQQYLQQNSQLYTQQYPQTNSQQHPQQYPQQYQQQNPQLYPQQPSYTPFASYPIPAVQANVQPGLPSQGKPMYPWNSYPSYEQQGIDAPYNTPFNINPYKQTLPKPPASPSTPPAPTSADVQMDLTQTEWNPYRPKKEQPQSQDQLQEVKLHAIPTTEAEYTSKQTVNKKNKKPRSQSLSTKLQQLQKKRAGTKRVSRRTGKSYPWMPD